MEEKSQNLERESQNDLPSKELVIPQKENNNYNNNKKANVKKRIIRQQKNFQKKAYQKKSSSRNKNVNNVLQNNGEVGLNSVDNLDHPKPLISDYYDEGKDEIKKYFIQKIEEDNKKEKDKNKKEEERYLNMKLEEDNKQIKLGVAKKFEKKTGIKLEGEKTQEEPKVSGKINKIKGKIKPILGNENLIRSDNIKNRNNIEKKVKKFKTEIPLDKKPINLKLNYKKGNYSESVKLTERQIKVINEPIINNGNNKQNFENNLEEKVSKINKMKKKEIKTINNNTFQQQSFLSLKNNKSINEQENHSNIRKNFQSNNKKYPISNNYRRENLNKSDIEKKSHSKTISFGIHQESRKAIQNIQNKNSCINNNNPKYISNDQTFIFSNNRINEKYQKIHINPKSQEKFNIVSSFPVSEFNNIKYQNEKINNNLFFEEKSPFKHEGKVKTQTFQRGGEFNNIQTKYVIVSKEHKRKVFPISNRIPFVNTNISQEINLNSTDIYTNIPTKFQTLETSFYTFNSYNNLSNNMSNNFANSFSNKNNYKLPFILNHKEMNNIPLNHISQKFLNKSQNIYNIRTNFNYNDINDRIISYNYINTENCYIDRNQIKNNDQYMLINSPINSLRHYNYNSDYNLYQTNLKTNICLTDRINNRYNY